MNAQFRIGQQVVNYDRIQTIRLYANAITAAGAEECTCVNCKNFAVQRTKAYPETFLALLNQVGIDAMKDWKRLIMTSEWRKLGTCTGVGLCFVVSLSKGLIGDLSGDPVYSHIGPQTVFQTVGFPRMSRFARLNSAWNCHGSSPKAEAPHIANW